MKTMLVFSTVYTFAVLFVSTKAEPKSTSCNEVRAAYSSKGFNANDVPNKGIHAIEEEWDNIPQATINSLINSMRRRCHAA